MEQRVTLREISRNLARYVRALEAGERAVVTRVASRSRCCLRSRQRSGPRAPLEEQR